MALASLQFVYAPDHHDCASLPGDERSKVILSRHKPDTLVIFVHGFRGDALETWQQFDQLVITNPRFKNVDFIFFGYESYLSNVLAGASFLYNLLNAVEEQNRAAIASVSKPEVAGVRCEYKRIILVAHSLGAVVCRWAIVRAVEEGKPWRSRLRLLLFAPAHTGSELAHLATTAAGGFAWVSLFVQAVKANVPLVRELDPSSRILTELAERVQKAKNEPCLKASRVIIAEREVVVSNLPFPGDPCPDALPDTDHISVCKPTAARMKPVQYLEDLLP
ncbi:MAG TPA: hypothetical protein VHC90_16495 [Bryobacteraceae bacterium]|nr:hypothetical protein [Bryobacteraceae bacterium]